MSDLSLSDMAVNVLNCADAKEKTKLSRGYANQWFQSRQPDKDEISLGAALPPDTPARPEKPDLLAPRDVPKRKTGTEKGRVALIHAIAHIELNAVDLHWDIIARFTDIEMPLGFYDDWVKAAAEESKHFNLLNDCLIRYDSHYGALAAHAGMWQAATDTATDFMGRLAVVPMVLEARGLDVTPAMINLFNSVKDAQTIEALETIYKEEVAHVAYGSKWFHFLCGRHNLDPKEQFHFLVRKYFHSKLRPPFNEEKRAEAGIPPDFYWPLTEDVD